MTHDEMVDGGIEIEWGEVMVEDTSVQVWLQTCLPPAIKSCLVSYPLGAIHKVEG